MKKNKNGAGIDKSISLFASIILVFGILAAFVFSVERKISSEMSMSAIQNLSESLELMKGTIEAILTKEADFQKLIAQELAAIDDPQDFVRSYNKNQSMVKMALVMTGETEGVSNIEEVFRPDELDFSSGKTVEGLPLSRSYVNYMGTWAYSMSCPVVRDGWNMGTLYIEYIYDSIDRSLPTGFYDGRAMLYIMDAESERLVLKPKGMGQRDAGHLNLEDFYRANNIVEPDIRAEVAECVQTGRNVLFYHKIRGKSSLNYMWAINGGALYLIGYVPVEAIQQEGRTVNQNILIVVVVMLAAFFLCCALYFLNQRQQDKIRKEQEKEREIHNQRLAEALQSAQIASNLKTTFLSNMSHDIRTPMNAVLGFTTLLDKDADNPVKVREYTKKITASGRHLLHLINDVLDVSKIESGKVVLNIEEFTLNDLVSSVDAIIRPMADEKNQNFHVDIIDVKHEDLMGDETRINQVLINLLSNAVKYTPQGGNIWFRMIGCRQRTSGYEPIRIEVEDDGYGMTPEYLETIFEAFTRAENSTTNKVQGTGLGMAITKNIIELMGGTIEVSSEVDKGSLFRVDIEFRIPERQSDQQFWAENGITKMLVAGSCASAGSNIGSLMEETGVLLCTAHSTKEAVEMIQKDLEAGEAPSIVLLDWELVESEGIEAAKKVREAAPAGTMLLFLASYDADGLDQTLEMEYTGILTKPFFISAFKKKIAGVKEAFVQEKAEEIEDLVDLEGLHFLAAEDNEINAEILKEILTFEGAACEIVENGRLALERFQSSKEGEFDAILMDVQMPVMNGYDATRAIRALDRSDAKEILIAAMTANAFVEDERDALEAGMDVHMSKPVDLELMKKVIRQHLKEKKGEK